MSPWNKPKPNPKVEEKRDFTVEEQKGVYSIHWARGDVDALVIPSTVFQSSQIGGGVDFGPGGLGASGQRGKQWYGESVIIVTHSGQTADLDTWKRVFPQILEQAGINTKVTQVYDAQRAFGQLGVSLAGSAVPYARDTEWMCKECGKTIPPNHPHVH